MEPSLLPEQSIGQRKMSRLSKIFIKVDGEGLLTDTIAISDVVNFDCYESIMTSAQRIISKFQKTPIENIVVDAVFYYKKRARSSRMNPVRINTTTDGFRAVAEHPTGEIPMGAVWNKKSYLRDVAEYNNSDLVGLRLKPQKYIEIEKAAYHSINRHSPAPPEPSVGIKPDPDAPPDKKRKTDSPLGFYKTYMPSDTTVGQSTRESKHDSQVPPPGISPALKLPHPAVSGIRQHKMSYVTPPPPIPANTQLKQTLTNVNKPGEGENGQPRTTEQPYKTPYRSHHSHYQWPDNVTCEVILTYNGISERKTLSTPEAHIVKNIVRGTMSKDQVDQVEHCNVNVKTAQEHLNETNCNRPVKSVHCHKDPITNIQGAKTEIYNLLSLLSLSKARFKQLLKWMSSLKLEEGSQGKFYLSERTVIENGLHVMFDRDEQAAQRLSHINKTRSRNVPAKIITQAHPPVRSVPDPTQNQVMYLVPSTIQGTNPHTGSIQVTNPPTGSLLNPGTSLLHPSVSPQFRNMMPMSESWVPTTTTQTKPAQTKTVNDPKPGENVAGSETEKQAKPHSVPSILRRKQKYPVQKVRTASVEPIVPIQMFKHYETENDKEKDELFPFDHNSSDKKVHLIIKQEAVEDYGEASDSTIDYDKASDKGVSSSLDYPLNTNSSNNYSDVLKSDVKMPQNLEQNDKPYEIVIKSEPIDDGYT